LAAIKPHATTTGKKSHKEYSCGSYSSHKNNDFYPHKILIRCSSKWRCSVFSVKIKFNSLACSDESHAACGLPDLS
jgi:hypothetical protein